MTLGCKSNGDVKGSGPGQVDGFGFPFRFKPFCKESWFRTYINAANSRPDDTRKLFGETIVELNKDVKGKLCALTKIDGPALIETAKPVLSELRSILLGMLNPAGNHNRVLTIYHVAKLAKNVCRKLKAINFCANGS